MKHDAPDATEALTRFARRGLWLALLLILLLGIYAVLANAFPESSAARHGAWLMSLLPIAIFFAIVWLRSSLRRENAHAANPAMHAVLHDELRQISMHKAFRAAFFSVLLCQPIMGFTLAWMPLPAGAQIMATVTIVVGACVFLATFLLCDRA